MVTGESLSSGLAKTNSPLRVSMLHFPRRRLSPLSHNEFVRLDVETRARHRHVTPVIHGHRARPEDERPQLREVLTSIVKIRKTIPAKDSLADPIPSPGQSSAKASSESGTVPDSVIASHCEGNFVRQIPLSRVAFHPMMASDEIERADETAVAPAIAQAAFDPALAVAKETSAADRGLRRLRPGRARP
jgi:hypothetical protein